jgi:xanthine/CO dehydrogenase XdhC/CoxF family maturation factor
MSLSLTATMSLVEELRRPGEDFCLVTVIRTASATSAKADAKAIVTREGRCTASSAAAACRERRPGRRWPRCRPVRPA